MKIKILSTILLTLMLAACSTQRETITTTMRDTAVTTATPPSQEWGPPPS